MADIELRDYFASVALGHLPRLRDEDETEKTVARAYALADAMLAARGAAKPRVIPLTRQEADEILIALSLAAKQIPQRAERWEVLKKRICGEPS